MKFTQCSPLRAIYRPLEIAPGAFKELLVRIPSKKDASKKNLHSVDFGWLTGDAIFRYHPGLEAEAKKVISGIIPYLRHQMQLAHPIISEEVLENHYITPHFDPLYIKATYGPQWNPDLGRVRRHQEELADHLLTNPDDEEFNFEEPFVAATAIQVISPNQDDPSFNTVLTDTALPRSNDPRDGEQTPPTHTATKPNPPEPRHVTTQHLRHRHNPRTQTQTPLQNSRRALQQARDVNPTNTVTLLTEQKDTPDDTSVLTGEGTAESNLSLTASRFRAANEEARASIDDLIDQLSHGIDGVSTDAAT
jgi:hypothetical protein